ncbi:hypothetical protein AVEN_261849-1 [Araneus ventricosus]|uniref:DNA helicase Pif1-like 2B domain-containing protein n=1 Tax=Araneus ventricosus TaxID=182803 RepID=A0A4Y2WPA2_ARAVE|nr:hypothetical protein AVEN_261849-1 [Araneus ventricosus]
MLSSFQQTCTKLGFLEGDHHWHDTTTEASQVKMPSQLRKLSLVICAFGEVEWFNVCYPKEQDPVKQLYNDLKFKAVTAEQLKGRAILIVTNDLSIELNNAVLNLTPGREEVCDSIDCILSEDPQDQLSYPEKFLNSLTPTGMPPHKLRLKKVADIMLLRNLMPSKGLCNGTRLIVTKLQRNVIEAEMIGSSSKETFLIPRIPLIP